MEGMGGSLGLGNDGESLIFEIVDIDDPKEMGVESHKIIRAFGDVDGRPLEKFDEQCGLKLMNGGGSGNGPRMNGGCSDGIFEATGEFSDPMPKMDPTNGG